MNEIISLGLDVYTNLHGVTHVKPSLGRHTCVYVCRHAQVCIMFETGPQFTSHLQLQLPYTLEWLWLCENLFWESTVASEAGADAGRCAGSLDTFTTSAFCPIADSGTMDH